MSEWEEYKLGSITKWKSGGTPSKQKESYWNGNVPWISAKTFKTSRICDSEIKITEEGLDKGSRIAEINSILLLVRGSGLFNGIPIGIVKAPVAFNQDIKAIEADLEKILPEYLFYWLMANRPLLVSKLEHTGIGAGKFETEIIKDLTLLLPPLPTQKAIAEILSSLDDKIELNNQINQNLESLAQALFKQWFIDFEFPNENGEPYKSSGGEMVESELGEIPKGWQVEFLSDLFNFLEGPGLRNWQYRLEGMPFINIRLIQDGDIRKNNISYISIEEFKDKYQHFALLENDLVLSTSGTLGKSAIVRKNHLPLMLNTSVIRFRPIESFCLSYMYQFLQSKNFIDEVKASATGSVQLNFGPVHLKKIKLIKPCESILNLFENSFYSVYNQIQHLRNENDELVKTRDYLLPKLISGELEINELPN